MTETSLPWAGKTTGDAGPYTADNWSDTWRKLFIADRTKQGVFLGYGNELEVAGAASPISIDTGAALVDGEFYENTAALSVLIPTPSSSTRIDRIVLRKDFAAQTVRVTRIVGTEGGAAPAITQTDGTTWDIPLAQISVNTGSTITVTDERDFLVSPTWPLLKSPTKGSEKTIASGVITLNGPGIYSVDTESDAASDVLETVNGLSEGMIVGLFEENSARTVIVDNGGGNIKMLSEKDTVLNDDPMWFYYDGSNLICVDDRLFVFGFTIGNGVEEIASGSMVDYPAVPPLYLVGIYGMADASGSVNLDIRCDSIGTEPDSADTIGSSSPCFAFSSQQFKNETTFTSWTRKHTAWKNWRLTATGAATTIMQLSVAVIAVRI